MKLTAFGLSFSVSLEPVIFLCQSSTLLFTGAQQSTNLLLDHACLVELGKGQEECARRSNDTEVEVQKIVNMQVSLICPLLHIWSNPPPAPISQVWSEERLHRVGANRLPLVGGRGVVGQARQEAPATLSAHRDGPGEADLSCGNSFLLSGKEKFCFKPHVVVIPNFCSDSPRVLLPELRQCLHGRPRRLLPWCLRLRLQLDYPGKELLGRACLDQFIKCRPTRQQKAGV